MDFVQNVVTRAREHVVSTFGTEVDSAALPTSIDTGRGRRLFMRVTRKFNGHNLRKTRSNIPISKCMTSFFSSYDR